MVSYRSRREEMKKTSLLPGRRPSHSIAAVSATDHTGSCDEGDLQKSRLQFSSRFFEELRAHKCPESRDSSKPPQPITDLSFLDGHNRFHCGLCLEELRQFRRIKYHVEKCRGGNIK